MPAEKRALARAQIRVVFKCQDCSEDLASMTDVLAHGSATGHTDIRTLRPAARRRKPKTTRHLDPYSQDEIAAILGAADRMVWMRRADGGDYKSGFGGVPDTEYVGRTVRVLLFSACHVSVLPKLNLSHLFTVAGKTYLRWRRPKNEKLLGIPVPDWAMPWIGEYLATPKAKSRVAYFKMLRAVTARIKELYGVDLNVIPLRCRHTGIVEMKEQFGLSDTEIADLAGCGESTIDTYTYRGMGRVTRMIAERGGLKLPEPTLVNSSGS